jgi:microsomal dipeptidase-like Zn-dependent dipeptidase
MKKCLNVAILMLFFGTTPQGLAAVVDLHAHPFMEQGMSLLFRGDFSDKNLKARDWRSRFDSQINEDTLESSTQIGFMVVSLYAHPFMNVDLRDSIRLQISRAKDFFSRSKNWVLARTPEEALSARKAGRSVAVLGLEGAAGILETESDLDEFIDRGGIRVVTLLHLTDDDLGGAAFLRGFRGAIFNPLAWIESFMARAFRERTLAIAELQNDRGLTTKGRELAEKLLARGVWIDLAHASDLAQKSLIPVLTESDRPLLYTHTICREHHHAERALAPWQLDAVASSRGIVGLMPSEEMLTGTTKDAVAEICPAPCQGQCKTGAWRLAAHWRHVAGRIGAVATVFGTDFNGGVPHLRPTQDCATGTALDDDGLWNVGHLGRLEEFFLAAGIARRQDTQKWSEHIIRTWSRVWQKREKK